MTENNHTSTVEPNQQRKTGGEGDTTPQSTSRAQQNQPSSETSKETPALVDESQPDWENIRNEISNGVIPSSDGRKPTIGDRAGAHSNTQDSTLGDVTEKKPNQTDQNSNSPNFNELPTRVVKRPIQPSTSSDPSVTQVMPGASSVSWMDNQPTQVNHHSTAAAQPESQGDTQPILRRQTSASSLPPVPAGTHDPLPHRADELDLGATQVSRTAFQNGEKARQPGKPGGSSGGGSKGNNQRHNNAANGNGKKKKGGSGCLVRGIIIFLFIIVLGIIVAGAFLVYQYFTIAATLPSVEGLKERASQFETTRIYDRNNQLLYEVLDPSAGRRTYIPLKQISPNVIALGSSEQSATS